MPDMKVEKNQDPSKFFGYLLELNVEIWRFEFFFLFRNLAKFGPIFHEKSFILVEITFFRWGFGENSPIKKNTVDPTLPKTRAWAPSLAIMAHVLLLRVSLRRSMRLGCTPRIPQWPPRPTAVCTLQRGREGWREDPTKSPAGGSQVFFALKYTLRFSLIDFDSSSSSSSSSTNHHHHPHHRIIQITHNALRHCLLFCFWLLPCTDGYITKPWLEVCVW